MNQQNTVRNWVIGIVSGFLVIAAVGSIVVKLVGTEFGFYATQDKSTDTNDTNTLSSEELIAGKTLGKEVYDMACMACHTSGLAGAPKLGDQISWASRISKGEATLITNAINGFNVMPPRGGRAELSDEDVKLAVRYIILAATEPVEPKIETTVPVNDKPAKPVQPSQTIAGRSGKEVYDIACTTCHTLGVAGSPKLGDKAGWANRITKGEATLVNNVINGFNIMPPRGGNAGLSDAEVKRAVQYILAAVDVGEMPTPVSEPIVPKASVKPPEKPVEAAPSQAVAERSGKEVYDIACTTCHTLGVAGSPKLGDKASWANRITKGEATLVNNVINGFNIMPPRGGNAELSDAEVKLAVQYMLTTIDVGEMSTQVSEPTTVPKASVKPPEKQVEAAPSQAIAGKSGKEVYDMACTTCHTFGVAGSPKLDDKASWANRITKGEATLVNNVINGFNVMPPRGGNAELSDAEVKLAVQYMLTTVGGAETAQSEPTTMQNNKKAELVEVVPEVVPSEISVAAGKSGKEVYDMVCMPCHTIGIAGAPKQGDKASWGNRIDKDEAVLVTSVINGLNVMPPRGGKADLSDAEIKRAVQYMLAAIGI